MNIDVNFMASVRRRHDRLVAGLLVASVVLSITIAIVLNNIGDKRERKKILQHALNAEIEKRTDLGRELKALRNIEAKGNPNVLNWLGSLKPYQGKSPGLLLYTLEKSLPEEIYLLAVDYDRVEGVATVNAVSRESDAIGDLIKLLQQRGDFTKVRIINKSEYNEKGASKFVLRLTYVERGE